MPMRIWTRQENTSFYPTRPFYMLNYNEDKIKEKMVNKLALDDTDQKAVSDAVNSELDRIRKKGPFEFTIMRDNYQWDKEHLRIESVKGRIGDDLPVNYFSLSVQSMSEDENYWLDSGAFVNL